jgi:hypothetical protein
VVAVRAPWMPQACRMIAAIVNGKSCIVLSIDVPPYGSRRSTASCSVGRMLSPRGTMRNGFPEKRG